MNEIIKFICKWIIPIGFVELFANDKIFLVDDVGFGTYWRLSESKKPIKGAGILIRRD